MKGPWLNRILDVNSSLSLSGGSSGYQVTTPGLPKSIGAVRHCRQHATTGQPSQKRGETQPTDRNDRRSSHLTAAIVLTLGSVFDIAVVATN